MRKRKRLREIEGMWEKYYSEFNKFNDLYY